MNYRCGSAIGCNEWRLLIRHRAVRKDTHAGPQRLPSANVPSCGQKKHTRWPATNSECWCAIMRSEKTRTLACYEFFGVQWITDAAARLLDAMNEGCWYAIVRSEKTHTLACNDCQVLMCHRAVRKNTLAGPQRCAIMRSEKTHTMACYEFFGVQWITDAAARSDAMNDGCWYAIVRSEKTHTLACNDCQVLMCHRAVRRNTHAGAQRIPSADVPSCGQKRHTRWPATNSSACNELRMRQRDRMQWMTAADTPSCGQKRHTRWPATTAEC